MANMYEDGLAPNSANYQPLTPLTQLARAAEIYPDQLAIIHGNLSFTYREFYRRSRQLASALKKQGVGKGDTVSVLLSNTPAMLEAHHGVPMAKAVLHSMNTRLDAAIIAFQLDHAETKVFIVDREFSDLASEALRLASVRPFVIDYDDLEFGDNAPFSKGAPIGAIEYEAFLSTGAPDYQWEMPDNEWDTIALNYTSGTTGNPKGVVYHHRGAALMGYANLVASNIGKRPIYLWTLPMFHCNGWCYPWTLALVGGTHVCLRWVRAKAIYDAIADLGVTHLCGAPIVMSSILNAPENEKRKFSQSVTFNTAAASPPEKILAQMAEVGFEVVHLYGLTETYGPAVVNEWNEAWNSLLPAEQAVKKARQGVNYSALEGLSVRDPQTMIEVPRDGQTIGEVMFRGNIVMKGYLKNKKATNEAFEGGWFHSGDLGVIYPDGYIQLKDRSKDIIISGGENISSIEVEDAIYKHDSVSTVGVVARPDDKWGETPCAFVELKEGHVLSAEELIVHCRLHLARFKCPKTIVFEKIPKTSTGKIQKFNLRKEAEKLN